MFSDSGSASIASLFHWLSRFIFCCYLPHRNIHSTTILVSRRTVHIWRWFHGLMSLVYTNKPGKRRPFCLYKTVTYEDRTAQSRELDIRDLKHRRRMRGRRRIDPWEDWIDNVVHGGKTQGLSARSTWPRTCSYSARPVLVMPSFHELRELLLLSYDDGTIDGEEFLLLYEEFKPKNPDFSYEE